MPSKTTHTVDQTQLLAADLVNSLGGQTILALYGGLGSGKTTFAQGIGQALGVRRVISPTFTLIRQYSLKHPVFDQFYHLDLYRLNSPQEVLALGIEELWQQPRALVVIEWPEKIEPWLPDHVSIYFRSLNSTDREIKII